MSDSPKKWDDFLEKRSMERIAERERNLVRDKVYTELLLDQIKLLKEKLEKVTKIAEEVCMVYGDAFNDDPYSDYNNEFALQKQKELKEILKQQKAG